MRIRGLEKKEAPWLARIFYRPIEKQFGKMLTPYKVWAYRPWPLLAISIFSLAAARSKVVDLKIKTLTSIRAAQLIGCPF